MGPPPTIEAGTFSRMAAMSMPGTILSQLGTSTRASKAWAMAIDSTVSAMSSRLGKRVVHALVVHGEAVADAHDAELEGHAAAGAHAGLDRVDDRCAGACGRARPR